MAKRYCPDCGTPLEQGDVFCKECGARVLEEEKSELQHVIPKEEPVQPAPEETISAKQNASKKRNLIIAVIAGILVAGGIGAAIAINAGRKPESPELSVDTETNKPAEFSEIITETETEKKTEKPVETTQPPTEAETEPPTTEPKGTDYVAAYTLSAIYDVDDIENTVACTQSEMKTEEFAEKLRDTFVYVNGSYPKLLWEVYENGDVNQDGSVNVADIVLLQKYLLASETLSKTAVTLADMDEDKCVDGFDLAYLKRAVLAK